MKVRSRRGQHYLVDKDKEGLRRLRDKEDVASMARAACLTGGWLAE